MLHQLHIHVLRDVHGPLVKAVVRGREGDLFKYLE